MDSNSNLTLSVSPLFVAEKGTYEIRNLEEVADKLRKGLDESLPKDAEIVDEDSYKLVYKSRTKVRKATSALKQLKRAINDKLTGQINEDIKSLLTILDEYDTNATERLQAFKPKEEKEEQSKWTIQVDCKDEKTYCAVKKYLKKKGLEPR